MLVIFVLGVLSGLHRNRRGWSCHRAPILLADPTANITAAGLG